MALNSSEIQVTQPNVLGDHAARLEEETNPEATGGDECLGGMELAVYDAAKHGKIDALAKYRERLHQIWTPTRNTVLHIYIACAMSTDPKEICDSAIIVQKILELCPPLLLQSNKSGDTALHIAARYGRTAIVTKIMQVSKMDRYGEEAWPRIIIETNKEGDTALHEAVRFNHIDVVKMLTSLDDHQQIFYRANVAGETPLYLAAERGYRDVVFQILHSCTRPAYQGPNGRTALHAAVKRNDKEMMKKLLEHTRVLTKAVDEDGCTPLHLAASLGHTSIVELLLKHDRSAAYVQEKEKNRTALHFAAAEGHKGVTRQLISHCPDCCELVDKNCRNVLHYSINAEKEDWVLDFVLKDPWLSNILLNGKDDNGDTPLHHLADTNYLRGPSAGGLAADARVDKMAYNNSNQNPFDILLQVKGNSHFSTTQGELKDKFRRNGVIPGCRIVRNKEEVAKEEKEKSSDDEFYKIRDSHLLVATLIATVSFAAGFTMPGGYQSDKGSDQGFAILARNAAFQAFVITNTIAMTLSSCSVLLLLISTKYLKRKVVPEAHEFLSYLTMLALIAMVIAFITGTYTVLGHSARLGITVCVLGFILFFVLVEFMIYDQRGLMRTLPIFPLSLALFLFSWLAIKMFHGIRRFFYKCSRLVAVCSSSLRRREMDSKMNVYNRC